MKVFRIIAIALGITTACEPPSDERLVLVNQSDSHLLYDYTCDELPPVDSPFGNMRVYYKDSPEAKAADINDYLFLIKPHEKKVIGTGMGTWESIVHHCPSQKIRLFLYDFNTIDHTDWQTVRSRKLWVTKYTVSLDSLERLNWRLSYDPAKR